MPEGWLIKRAETEYFAVDTTQLVAWAKERKVRPSDFIGRAGSSDFVRADELPELSGLFREPSADTNRVSVTDIDMHFLSMVRFMVKWALASIPALIILILFFGVAALSIGSLLSGAFAITSAIPGVRFSRDATGETPEATTDKGYADKISVSDLIFRMPSKGMGDLRGKVTNTGSKIVVSMTARINYKNSSGAAVGDQSKDLPLFMLPGESEDFNVFVEPPEGTSSASVVVVSTRVR